MGSFYNAKKRKNIMMKLYDLNRSGNCYKIRLFLSLLGIECIKIPVNIMTGEHKTDEFLSLNPNGLLPVLTDNVTTLYDSSAILVYLAKRYDRDNWLPDDAIVLSNVIRWLTFEQNENRYGLARARAKKMNIPTDFAKSGTLEECHALSAIALKILDNQLEQTKWLATQENPTVCDIACYPYTAMCEESGVSLKPYKAVNKWLKNVEGLDGYIPLPQYKKI